MPPKYSLVYALNRHALALFLPSSGAAINIAVHLNSYSMLDGGGISSGAAVAAPLAATHTTPST